MYTGTLQKTQEQFYIRPLRDNLFDVGASVKLQNAVLSRFDDDQTLIHVQTSSGFARRCDGVHGVTLGVFIPQKNGRDKLIAQQTLELSPDASIPLPKQLLVSRSELGCVSGFMVHPEYWGNGLTDMLLTCLQQWGTQSFGKKGFLSVVDAANPFSYNVLMNRGYAIINTYIDPADNGETYAFLNHPATKGMRQVQVEELPDNLFKEVTSILRHPQEPRLITKRQPAMLQHRLVRTNEKAAA